MRQGIHTVILVARVDATPALTTSATLFRIDFEDRVQFDQPCNRFVNQDNEWLIFAFDLEHANAKHYH
ncbi:hypothetical protein MKP05_01165 [Halomonas sp. EGI 63088]|uniref:Uncharacterized protein n=1 Tax=Halomonas flagellata TaxID=2920385 RepID=A0ABS9RP25_9GAMM|nr:hypothetical protein [Halomonas flagellata]MCH4561736.1 hypothetical protein [Halomonas flagellata]